MSEIIGAGKAMKNFSQATLPSSSTAKPVNSGGGWVAMAKTGYQEIDRAAWSEGMISKEMDMSVNWSENAATSLSRARSRIDGLKLSSCL